MQPSKVDDWRRGREADRDNKENRFGKRCH